MKEYNVLEASDLCMNENPVEYESDTTQQIFFRLWHFDDAIHCHDYSIQKDNDNSFGLLGLGFEFFKPKKPYNPNWMNEEKNKIKCDHCSKEAIPGRSHNMCKYHWDDYYEFRNRNENNKIGNPSFKVISKLKEFYSL